MTVTGTELIPLVDLRRVNGPLEAELLDACRRVLASGRYVSGPEAELFESELAEYVGTSCAVAVGSGTSALHLLLLAHGIGPGDEVLVPANTFWATAEAVVHAGAAPVLVDVLDDTANMDPKAAAAACGPRTAAILAVHLYGQPAAMTELRLVAERHGVLLLEDAAQAIGAWWEGSCAGALGAGAGFSFYPGKNLGALGEAGAIAFSDPALAARARSLRNHGSTVRYLHDAYGFNERIDEMQAAMLRIKLRHLPSQQMQRDAALAQYRPLLAGIDGIRTITVDPRAYSVHHLLVVRTKQRDEVLRDLHASSVDAAIHYPVPLHLQEAGARLGIRGQFPVAEGLADEILSLPLFPGLTSVEVCRCTEALALARSNIR